MVNDTPKEQYKDDNELYSVKFDTNHKTFFLDLKSSDRGRYLKISEKRFGKKTTIIVPEEGIGPLLKGVEEIKGKL
jgi:hypothetical protein